MSLFRWVEDKLIPNEILKLCDIRGKYPKPLGKPEAHTVGLAIGTLLKESKNRNIKTVIGGDIRESSEPLKKSLLKGRLDKISKGIVDVEYKMKFPKKG